MARITNADEVMLGKEPDGSIVNHSLGDYREKLIRVLNWYSYDHGQDHAKKYAVEYMKKFEYPRAEIKTIESVRETKFNTSICFAMRMVTRGAILDEVGVGQINDHIGSLLSEKVEAAVVKKETTRPNIRDAMAEKIQEYLGEVEGFIDSAIAGAPIDLYSDLKAKNIPQQYVKSVIDLLSGKLPELNDALLGKDDQLVEGYSNYTTGKLRKLIKYIEESIAGAEKYADFKKANRKQPVRKAKPPSVQVAKLSYKREDETYKINSALATDIIGAEQLWVFNTKTKKLGVYRATGAAGLGVKGSSIINYDPETSSQKTLRKPEAVLAECLKGGKLVLRKLLDGVNAKSSAMNGRINADTVLMRIVK